MTFFQKRSLAKQAKNILNDVKLTLNMNRDLFDAETVAEFERSVSKLATARKSAYSDPVGLETAAQAALDYANERRPPCKSPLVRELVETAVVAIGVAMAFRAYFFQPFKIPTGSMQPTLYGIHSETLPRDFNPELSDSPPFKQFKWLFTGVWYKEIVAQTSCTISVYQDDANDPGYFLFYVDGKKNRIPADALTLITLNNSPTSGRYLVFPDEVEAGTMKRPHIRVLDTPGMPDAMNPTRRLVAQGQASAGDVIWKGYNIGGDQLFVNRIAWNFFPPKRDDVIVFSTSRPSVHFSESAAEDARLNARKVSPPHTKLQWRKIPVLPLWFVETPFSDPEPANHYIKRLVGLPGELITIGEPFVYADGQKQEGFFGMDRVAHDYAGYTNIAPEYAALPIALRDDEYLPMGDNTMNSFDGRYWGGVPRKNMLGPAAFVYWPISKRWCRPVK